MGFASTEINIEIWITFRSFLVYDQNKKVHPWLFFLYKTYNFLNEAFIIIYIYEC